MELSKQDHFALVELLLYSNHINGFQWIAGMPVPLSPAFSPLHLLHSCLDSQRLNIFHGFMPLDAFAGSLVQFKVLADLY